MGWDVIYWEVAKPPTKLTKSTKSWRGNDDTGGQDSAINVGGNTAKSPFSISFRGFLWGTTNDAAFMSRIFPYGIWVSEMGILWEWGSHHWGPCKCSLYNSLGAKFHIVLDTKLSGEFCYIPCGEEVFCFHLGTKNL